jgi:hypothetical protein
MIHLLRHRRQRSPHQRQQQRIAHTLIQDIAS